ncbi:glutamate--cysteine ligase [Pseudochelatococcus contaminans]|uniref:Glutamate--cysteine ligase n=1 Tax=Pseudochelatococcus contaminans TaxID=1538103 RepID=A0A7W5Z1C2_9HYPH|nr:glutamate--cysteine ligase [Pseudochelatococcus contaminans]MBB3808226.1 glutamate--cysteine ligase [Pseudochelatococcus contaminans]
MARDSSDPTPIGSHRELVDHLARGCRPAHEWRLGTEHEKIPFYRSNHAPVPYAGDSGIRALLEGLAARTGWQTITEEGLPIGLFDDVGGGAVSLEPGGQFELSGAPLRSVHETRDELFRHLTDVKAVAESLGIGFLTLGESPLWTRAQTPVMPKGRYRIMMDYMPRVGQLGLDMMFRTTTVQVNLDFSSEADMVKKLRVSLALQPLATALFANSPFTDGRPNGLLSARSEIWRDTDADRTGMLAFAFEDGMGFERYVDWVLDVPTYFVKRGDRYHDVAGRSFRDLLDGRMPGLEGERATLSDWSNHLSTVFPEVRLKQFLEMRGADAGPAPMLLALPAFWVGLLYDSNALDAAWDLVRDWTEADRQSLRDAVPREGLAATIRGRPLRELGREVLALARAGLSARALIDNAGDNESRYLDPLDIIVASGRTQAEDLLALWNGRWDHSVEPAFEECVF